MLTTSNLVDLADIKLLLVSPKYLGHPKNTFLSSTPYDGPARKFWPHPF